MNTPTPEDHALAERLEGAQCGGAYLLSAEMLANEIADHCAPLRERIGTLEKELEEEKHATN